MAAAGVPLGDTSYTLGLGPALARDASWRSALRLLTALLATHDPPSARARARSSPLRRRAAQAAEGLLRLLLDCGACRGAARSRSVSSRSRRARARDAAAAGRVLGVLEAEAEARARRDARAAARRAAAAAADAVRARDGQLPGVGVADGLGMWRRMRRAHVAPDGACGLAALRALRRAGRWRECVAVLRALEHRFGVAIDAEMLGTTVGACELAGAWHAARTRACPTGCAPRARHARSRCSWP